MKFEKLNENKIRITLDLKELKDKNIDYQSLMSNPSNTQKLFIDMLNKAEKEIGFKTKDYRIMVEALATIDGSFIVTVTRSSPIQNEENKPKKAISFKRKVSKLSTSTAIYLFDTFDDFSEFCSYLNSNSLITLDKISKNFTLYTYNHKYYLLIDNINLNYKYLKTFYYTISEFANSVNNQEVFKNWLTEHGSLLIKKNAIKTTLKYFN